jgi:apolipoprotein N-acyltransferase
LKRFAANAWPSRAASLLAGAAAALAHPPFGFLPGLLGYAVLLALIDRAPPGHTLRSAFFRGWLAGLPYFAISTWWVAEAFFVDAEHQAWMAPFALVFVAAGLALFWGAAAALYRALAPTGALRLLTFAGALALLEWLRGHLATGFPWDLPGETWRAGSAPSQAASLLGAYGLTWVTVAVAAAPGLGLGKRDARLVVALAVLALAGLYGYGLWRLTPPVARPAHGQLQVRIVQPNTPERASYDAASFADVVRRHLVLTARPAARAPDVVIWSEAGIPAPLEDYLAPGTWTEAEIEAALKPGQMLITGGFRAERAPKGAYAPDGHLYRNSLLVLQRAQAGLRIVGLYDKHRLVPFGEYLPFDQFVAPLGVKDLIHVGDGFTPGPPPRPMRAQGLPPFQPLICYEALFPEFIREGSRAAHLRPAFIVNISDDAWFGATSGPLQHLNLASYRAIEEGLPMVRATPTGVSAVIDAFGRIQSGESLGEGAFGAIDAALPPALPPTPFDKWGDALFGLMLVISAVSGPAATLRRKG